MINLEKFEERKENVKVALEKYNIPNQKAVVKFCIDCSGSMRGLYRNGEVQEIFERLLPLAALLDDDGVMQVYKFNTECHRVGDATVDNAEGFVNNIDAIGGTSYAPIINTTLKNVENDVPTFVIVITDGDCGDSYDTEKAIRAASSKNVFYQFVGIGYERFDFLEELDNLKGRYIDNAGFFKVKALNKMSDKELYDLLIKEFPTWLARYKKPSFFTKLKNAIKRLFGR